MTKGFFLERPWVRSLLTSCDRYRLNEGAELALLWIAIRTVSGDASKLTWELVGNDGSKPWVKVISKQTGACSIVSTRGLRKKSKRGSK